ncbi:polysaccharide biosynthesis C-terminal domain-containing protein [Mucilaginibacter sp. BT774]|uniref:oligosaccharide flippase family protein n=1 Tax=Mucilaginibacter sp. BT774 TaxID=3062276 RepID=UPI002675F872|nr:polysaccharide biosynthesis C-terminal domain-containing protein [Mucilaginibacter sp. BT774]MDO3626832.1 polysaccharide biosynthesis C-terminal domain-containing protein [Mucilaginibacter sp. BT774]
MSTAKKFAGQTAIYGLSTIISRMIYFILTPIYTRTLPVGGNGIFTTMYGNASIVNAILAFGMETTYFRYLQKREENKQQVYNNAFAAVVAVSVVFLVFCLLFLNQIINYMQAGVARDHADYAFYVKSFLVILVVDAFCVIPFAKIRADGRPVRYAVIKCTNIFFVMAFNLFFLFGVPYMIKHHLMGAEWMLSWYRPHWVGYVFLANATASILTVVLLLPEILKLKLKFDGSMFREMFAYSWPVLIANISFIINESLDKVMLKHMLPQTISDQQVGIYGTCAKIAIFLSVFVQAFRLGAEPFFFSHAKNKNSGDTYARIMNYFVITVAIICVAVIANVNIVALIIVGKQSYNVHGHMVDNVYWSGLSVVPPLLFGYLSLGIYMNLSVWYKLSDQTKYGLYISGIGAVLTIILNWVFIPKFSYMASAWISLIAYATMMILSYIWGQKNYNIPYNLKKNLAYIIISVILVYLSFHVFKRNIFAGNALLILFVTGTYFVERKELKAIFTKQ